LDSREEAVEYIHTTKMKHFMSEELYNSTTEFIERLKLTPEELKAIEAEVDLNSFNGSIDLLEALSPELVRELDRAGKFDFFLEGEYIPKKLGWDVYQSSDDPKNPTMRKVSTTELSYMPGSPQYEKTKTRFEERDYE
jgi:hypothetical protein